jgi:activator of HSP90 ATPase
MNPNSLTRREVSARLLSTLSVAGFAVSTLAFAEETASAGDGVSRNCECIHQEVTINAGREHVYQALTQAKRFAKVVEFGLPGAGASTIISPHLGGEFSLFGDRIIGRHLEMVQNERLVQAWREKVWDPGVYSIVRFQMNDEAGGTHLVFDHTGFPQGAAEHLAIGWKSHYWDPLKKYLV